MKRCALLALSLFLATSWIMTEFFDDDANAVHAAGYDRPVSVRENIRANVERADERGDVAALGFNI